MNTKICTACKIEKDLSEFQKEKSGKLGVRGNCKICQRLWKKNHYQANKEEVKQKSKVYRINNLEKIKSNYSLNKEQHKSTQLKSIYGITIEQYNQMLEAQNGVCAICGKVETAIHWFTKATIKLAVDHNHQTGQIRGLLCSNCNTMLGKAKDNLFLIESALNYLKKF